MLVFRLHKCLEQFLFIYFICLRTKDAYHSPGYGVYLSTLQVCMLSGKAFLHISYLVTCCFILKGDLSFLLRFCLWNQHMTGAFPQSIRVNYPQSQWGLHSEVTKKCRYYWTLCTGWFSLHFLLFIYFFFDHLVLFSGLVRRLAFTVNAPTVLREPCDVIRFSRRLLIALVTAGVTKCVNLYRGVRGLHLDVGLPLLNLSSLSSVIESWRITAAGLFVASQNYHQSMNLSSGHHWILHLCTLQNMKHLTFIQEYIQYMIASSSVICGPQKYLALLWVVWKIC